MPSTNHPHCSAVVERFSMPGDAPPAEAVVFEGQSTTTPDGRTEYTVSLAGLSPAERMTHWLTIDADQVVSLEDCR